MWTPWKIAKALDGLSKHLQFVRHVEALQIAQKEMSAAMSAMSDRVAALEAKLVAISAEAKLESVKETQNILNAVHGRFHERIEALSIQVSHIKDDRIIDVNDDQLLLSNKKLEGKPLSIGRRRGGPKTKA
jgi:hypothetical protein